MVIPDPGLVKLRVGWLGAFGGADAAAQLEAFPSGDSNSTSASQSP